VNGAYDYCAKDILKKCGEADFNAAEFSLTLAAASAHAAKCFGAKVKNSTSTPSFRDF
jgi:hypothetical protein